MVIMIIVSVREHVTQISFSDVDTQNHAKKEA
jgi:hypothetical protein